MKLKSIFIFLIAVLVFNFLLSIGFSDTTEKFSTLSTATKWYVSLAGYWLIFLIASFIIIVVGIWRLSKLLLTIGMILLLLSILITELAVFFPLIGVKKTFMSMKECSTFTGNILQDTSCIFTGYIPEGNWLGIVTFFIFAIITPFGLIYAAVYYFSDFIYHRGVRNVITFSIALITFRGIFASLFVEMLEYGIMGIGILLVDVLLVGFIWRAAFGFFGLKIWENRQSAVEYLAELNRLEERRKELKRAKEQALAMGNKKEADRIQKEIENIEKAIKEETKRAKRKGVTPSPTFSM